MAKVTPTARSKADSTVNRLGSPNPDREPGTLGVGAHWPDLPDPQEHTHDDGYGPGDNFISDETANEPDSR